MKIPFNTPHMTGREIEYIKEAHAGRHLSGDGPFTRRCERWLEHNTGCHRAFLTHSCTGALEMAAILADIRPGDEVIMPSFTFVSTANAFVLRGGVPVFVDIRPDTLNLDEKAIEAAITPRTKAIAVVHYAGVACEMDAIMEIAERHRLLVVEDAAQGLMANYRNRPLGSIGHFGAISFHETKNVIAGEGGALLVNDPRYIERAEIIWEKGTNRKNFFRGLVDKYTWMDIGSSFLPSELTAAFLLAQFEDAAPITACRLDSWNAYHRLLEASEQRGRLRRPLVPFHCQHNAHMYYVLLPDTLSRTSLLDHLRGLGIGAIFHYIPLHDSPAGIRYGRTHGPLHHTSDLSARVLRLPLWKGLPREAIQFICNEIVLRSQA